MHLPKHSLFSPQMTGGILAVLLIASFFPVLIGGQSFYYRDFGVLAIPTATYHREAFLNLQLPLWNALSNCGAPFLAQWGTMVCYPPALLYVLLPMPWSLNFFCLAHLWAGGMGMYFLARNWKLESLAAALAAVAFIFNGIALGTLTWPNYTAALGLFPWVLLSAERAWDPQATRSAARIVIASMAAAMQLLAGVPELALFTWIVAGTFFVLRFVQSPGLRRGLLLRAAAVVLVTSGLVAIQLLPFWELLRHSQRTPGFAAEKWALPPWGWANLILPRFHTFKTAEGTAFQTGQEFLSSTYLGAPLLMLAVFGMLRREVRFRLLGLLAILGMILALGSSGYLYPLLKRIFPFLGVGRYPVKFLFLTAFVLPILSAWGLQVFLQFAEKTRRNALVIASGAGIALLACLVWFNLAWPFPLDWPADIRQDGVVRGAFLILFAGALWVAAAVERTRAAAVTLLLLLLAIDARTHLPNQNPTTASSIFTPGLWEQAQPEAARALGPGRVFISPAAEERLLHSMIPEAQQDLLGKRLALWSHLNLLDGIPKVNGSSTLQVRQQAEVQKYLYSGTNQNLSAWLDFLCVSLQTSSNSVIEWERRPRPMPFITGGQHILAEPASFNGFPANWNPAVEVFLDDAKAVEGASSATAVTFSDVQITPQQILFTAESGAPTVAVIAQSWYPAWKYSVVSGGRTVSSGTVLRANHAFQAVPLPRGKAVVRIYYSDTFFLPGSGISVAFLIASVVILAKAFRRNKSALLKVEKGAA